MVQTEQERIADLEAKLLILQKTENGGKDPVLLAKAKQYAKMGWYDVVTALEAGGFDNISDETLKGMRESLIEKKYSNLAGETKTPMAWVD